MVGFRQSVDDSVELAIADWLSLGKKIPFDAFAAWGICQRAFVVYEIVDFRLVHVE